jgi:hypothetical protein
VQGSHEFRAQQTMKILLPHSPLPIFKTDVSRSPSGIVSRQQQMEETKFSVCLYL